MRHMPCKGFVAIALIVASVATHADELLQFTPPTMLKEPMISRSALGATYDYQPRAEQSHLALQITLGSLPPEVTRLRDFSANQCVELFLAEIRKNKPGFFAMPLETPMTAGPLELQQVRWTYRATTAVITGVTSCEVRGNRFLSINFEDRLQDAAATFPAIRASVKALAIAR